MARLTDRQVAVLAAIERLGSPTIPALTWQEFPETTCSAIWDCVQRLEARGLVSVNGDRSWCYRGDPAETPAGPHIGPEQVVRVRAVVKDRTPLCA